MKIYLTLLTIIALAIMYSCNGQQQQSSVSNQDPSVAGKQAEYPTYTQAQVDSIAITLIGTMPRQEIYPHIAKLQGKEYKWVTPEAWKFTEEDAVEELLKWNEAHNDHDAQAIIQMYELNSAANMYGKLYTLQEALAIKEQLFAKYPDFKQVIVPGSVRFEGTEDFTSEVYFTKRVTMGGQTKDYNSYLYFAGVKDMHGLTNEGDLE